jgi:hypothetical protein
VKARKLYVPFLLFLAVAPETVFFEQGSNIVFKARLRRSRIGQLRGYNQTNNSY